jgi:ubiquinone/menaquinone biosynthesis C-methylase UbiE
MSLIIDREKNEINALRQVTDWRGKRVLEIGCGNGRLTRRIAKLGAHIEAIDPHPDLINVAGKNLPRSFAPRVRFIVGKASRLEYAKCTFDLVLFSWSLWWILPEGMVHALRQARRVLKDGGCLLDLRPAPALRHVGIEVNDSYQQVAIMRERLDEQYAADRAVKEMVKAGLLRLESRTRFDCTRRMDRFTEFQAWLEEPARLSKIRSPKRLLESVKEALKSRTEIPKSQRGKLRIVVLGPVDLCVLRKSG